MRALKLVEQEPELDIAEVESWDSRLQMASLAPNGIQKLRELILELAFRGKLVPQNSADESITNFLKEMKCSKKLNNDSMPYLIPATWGWALFGDVLDFSGGGQPPKNKFSDTQLSGYVQLIQIRDLGEKPQPVYIKKELASKFCTEKDIMVGRYGASVGKVFWGKDGAYNVALVKIIDRFNTFHSSFLFHLLKSPIGQSLFLGISRSAQDGFNKADIGKKYIPLAPIAEQKRIVAKIDELMALCDKLESQKEDAASAHETLVKALLGTLTQSQTARDFQENWQRIAKNFNVLFTTESSFEALKQTILQLAVMGKLVPQNPKEEPASELLKRIKAEKEKLIKAGKIKKDKPLPEITDDEKPFDIPKTWDWCRFSRVTEIRSELVKSQDFQSSYQVAPDSIEKGTGKLLFKRTVKDSGVIGPNNRFYAGQILYSKIRPSLSKAVIVDFDGLCSADMYPINTALFPKFLLLQILSEHFLVQVKFAENRVKMPKLNQESLSLFTLAIPPIEEQKRIVSKVDELISMCNTLKEQLTKFNNLHEQLATTLVEKAVAA
jgi:type I restriction enzyme S subunit